MRFRSVRIGASGLLPRNGDKTGRRHHGVQRSSSCVASRGERPAGARPERDVQARAAAAASPARAPRAASRTPRRAMTGSRRTRRESTAPPTADVKSTLLYTVPTGKFSANSISYLLYIHNPIVRTFTSLVKVNQKYLAYRR